VCYISYRFHLLRPIAILTGIPLYGFRKRDRRVIVVQYPYTVLRSVTTRTIRVTRVYLIKKNKTIYVYTDFDEKNVSST